MRKRARPLTCVLTYTTLQTTVKCAVDLLKIAKGLAYDKTACDGDGDGLADGASGGAGAGWRSRRNRRLDRLILYFNTLAI